uniref:Uncharacterized protein n=1 Tax=Rhizophagus irregularis (strain DAOM 181602 / DAOM 197198 / MUCL 43194) TaxID=747089 RepID=U9U3P4_RHIID
MEKVLEWIPHDRFYDIKYIAEDRYRANWIDGNIIDWDYFNQNWDRRNQNMIVELKKLNSPTNITLEYVNKISKAYGITQDPETKDYMIVLNVTCKECNYICYTRHFQQNFNNWTSGNDDIDSFIQDAQLSSHYDVKEVLEWIPHNRFYDIKYVAEDIYRANWIDGNIIDWEYYNQNWKRENQNVIVKLKKLKLNNPKNITLEYMNNKSME